MVEKRWLSPNADDVLGVPLTNVQLSIRAKKKVNYIFRHIMYVSIRFIPTC